MVFSVKEALGQELKKPLSVVLNVLNHQHCSRLFISPYVEASLKTVFRG